MLPNAVFRQLGIPSSVISHIFRYFSLLSHKLNRQF